jgi:hypothetical protein
MISEGLQPCHKDFVKGCAFAAKVRGQNLIEESYRPDREGFDKMRDEEVS